MRNLWEAPRSVQHTEKPAPNLKRALKTWTHLPRINIPKWATLRLNTGVPIRDKQIHIRHCNGLRLQWVRLPYVPGRSHVCAKEIRDQGTQTKT